MYSSYPLWSLHTDCPCVHQRANGVRYECMQVAQRLKLHLDLLILRPCVTLKGLRSSNGHDLLWKARQWKVHIWHRDTINISFVWHGNGFHLSTRSGIQNDLYPQPPKQGIVFRVSLEINSLILVHQLAKARESLCKGIQSTVFAGQMAMAWCLQGQWFICHQISSQISPLRL